MCIMWNVNSPLLSEEFGASPTSPSLSEESEAWDQIHPRNARKVDRHQIHTHYVRKVERETKFTLANIYSVGPRHFSWMGQE